MPEEDEPGPQPPGISGIQEQQFFAATELHRQQMNLGAIGKMLGGGLEKAGNIAFIAILACFVLVGILLFRTDLSKDGDFIVKVLGYILSVVTLALGYLFGARHPGGPSPPN